MVCIAAMYIHIHTVPVPAHSMKKVGFSSDFYWIMHVLAKVRIDTICSCWNHWTIASLSSVLEHPESFVATEWAHIQVFLTHTSDGTFYQWPCLWPCMSHVFLRALLPCNCIPVTLFTIIRWHMSDDLEHKGAVQKVTSTCRKDFTAPTFHHNLDPQHEEPWNQAAWSSRCVAWPWNWAEWSHWEHPTPGPYTSHHRWNL